ncbi:MAG TPA: TetR/AcrR family transcriptional regulator [Solirubrobacteraceae bacterium]
MNGGDHRGWDLRGAVCVLTGDLFESEARNMMYYIVYQIVRDTLGSRSMSLEIPSSTSPRPTPTERRQRIEDAAARLFAQRGYAATTVDDIVEAAGLTKPMLYRHFESKKHLHMALLERHRDELAAAPLDQFIRGRHDPPTTLGPMIEAWFAHIEGHPYTWRMLFADTTGDPDVQALHSELRARQRAADVALLREFAPTLPEAQLEPLGEAIRCALTGLALWWLEHPHVPRAVLVDTMLRITQGFLAGL